MLAVWLLLDLYVGQQCEIEYLQIRANIRQYDTSSSKTSSIRSKMIFIFFVKPVTKIKRVYKQLTMFLMKHEFRVKIAMNVLVHPCRSFFVKTVG